MTFAVETTAARGRTASPQIGVWMKRFHDMKRFLSSSGQPCSSELHEFQPKFSFNPLHLYLQCFNSLSSVGDRNTNSTFNNCYVLFSSLQRNKTPDPVLESPHGAREWAAAHCECLLRAAQVGWGQAGPRTCWHAVALYCHSFKLKITSKIIFYLEIIIIFPDTGKILYVLFHPLSIYTNKCYLFF